MGLGCAGGPGLASLIFSGVGFEKTFYVFGAICLVNLIMDIYLLPSYLNLSPSKQQKKEMKTEISNQKRENLMKQQENQDTRKVTNWFLFSNINVVCTYMMMFLGCLNVNFWLGGYLANHLANLGMKEEYFGYICSI